MVDVRECQWCGVHHGPHCPLVKSIEYFQDGTVKRVEFLTPADYPQYPLYPQPYGDIGASGTAGSPSSWGYDLLRSELRCN